MKNFFSHTGAALIALAGVAGCTHPTGTPEDLARTVVAYLADNDFDGYLANTVMTADQGFEICPRAPGFKLDVGDFRDEFDDCRKAFNFEGADVTIVSPKLETLAAGSKECGNSEPLNTADSVEITVTSDHGTFKFKLDDVVETLDGWRQVDDMRCSVDVAGSKPPPSGP